MKKKYEINYLSEDFFEKYDSKHFPEIEHKLNRPYLVLVLKVENNTYAIPFRTNVSHKACYRFKNSSRDTHSFTGLDYSKAVVVNDDRYIGTSAFIDEKEFLEL
ncbi:type III toxin-antitoxin system TenpIN family toxin, partial [Ruminococcus sp.]